MMCGGCRGEGRAIANAGNAISAASGSLPTKRHSDHQRLPPAYLEEVGDRVPRLAAALRGVGIADGAFVAALAFNSDRYVELFFAVPWAGGAFAPLNIRWSAPETPMR